MTLRSRINVIGVWVLLLLVVQACSAGSSNNGGVALRKTLVYAQAFNTVTFDPHKMNGTELVLSNAMYDTLVSLDPKDPSRIVSRLAESWTANSDNTQFTFHLKKNVVFSTGNPVTADDVKFSLDRLLNIKSSVSFIMEGYKSSQVVDPSTIVIDTTGPQAPFLVKMTGPQVGIIDSKVAKQHGAVSDATAITADTAEAYFNTPASLGSGPFTIDSYVPNDHVVLKRNPKYWGPAPTLDKVIVQNVQDVAVQRQLLEAGSIDIAAGLDFPTAAQMEHQTGINISYAHGTTNFTYLFMTTSPQISAPLSKMLVRQAVERAINYDGLLQLANGHAQRLPTMIPAGILGCCGVQPIQENLDQAKQLLAQAGYPNGFAVQFTYPNVTEYFLDYSVLVTKLQSDLARVGIKLNLEPIGTYSAFLAKYRAGTASMGISGGGGISDPDDFASTEVSTTGNYAHRLHYANPAVDQLYPQSLSTSGAARIAVYTQLQQLFQQDAVLEGLVQPDYILASSTRVSGYEFYPEELNVDFSKISVKA